jgi:flavin-dependent dehydrogenase
LRIAILGMGIAGSYLYRLLSLKGIQADCYDIRRKEVCLCSSCAWGVEEKSFRRLISYAELDPDRYIYQSFKEIYTPEPCRASLCTINKPKLLKDLQDLTFINLTGFDISDIHDYDVVIDSTGVDRAILIEPKYGDRIIHTHQYRVKDNDDRFIIEPISLGYWWHFPLGNGQSHVGCGSLVENPQDVICNNFSFKNCRIICSCSGRERLLSPLRSKPIVHKNIYGVGESIGCVMSGCGAGIIPSLECAKIFVECLIKNRLDLYEKKVLRHFRYLERDAIFLDKLINGHMGVGSIGILDSIKIYPNVRRAGMYPGVKKLLSLARRSMI